MTNDPNDSRTQSKLSADISPDAIPVPEETPERKYEESGLYPEDGKPFRLVALLLSLTGVVIFLAVAAAILNFVLI